MSAIGTSAMTFMSAVEIAEIEMQRQTYHPLLASAPEQHQEQAELLVRWNSYIFRTLVCASPQVVPMMHGHFGLPSQLLDIKCISPANLHAEMIPFDDLQADEGEKGYLVHKHPRKLRMGGVSSFFEDMPHTIQVFFFVSGNVLRTCPRSLILGHSGLRITMPSLSTLLYGISVTERNLERFTVCRMN